MKNSYLLGESDSEMERLQNQAILLDRQSHSLLEKVIVPGMNIFEIGCGIGNASLLLATYLDHHGSIDAIDISEKYISAANNKIQLCGYTNVNFQKEDVRVFETKKKYDVIYGRAILHHLQKPVAIIDKAIEMCQLGGYLVFEEPDVSALKCYPDNSSFNKLVELCFALAELSGWDFSFSQKLCQCFRQQEALEIELAQYMQPILNTEREKSIIPGLFASARTAFVKHDLISEKEADGLQHELILLSKQKDVTIEYGKIAQVVSKKIAV